MKAPGEADPAGRKCSKPDRDAPNPDKGYNGCRDSIGRQGTRGRPTLPRCLSAGATLLVEVVSGNSYSTFRVRCSPRLESWTGEVEGLDEVRETRRRLRRAAVARSLHPEAGSRTAHGATHRPVYTGNGVASGSMFIIPRPCCSRMDSLRHRSASPSHQLPSEPRRAQI